VDEYDLLRYAEDPHSLMSISALGRA
jgi:hypothetical protein